MVMQPNLGHGIMVTFKMALSTAHANATICICFVDDAMSDHLIDLDFLSTTLKSGLVGTSTLERLRRESKVMTRRVGICIFLRELKAGIFKLKDL